MGSRKLGLLALLAGCGSETNIVTPLPYWEPSDPAPIPDTTQEDVILQVTIPVVDVLFVIDNSCSMDDEQTALTSSFPGFIGYFVGSGLEWHVGVTSTDLDNPFQQGRLREAQGYKFLDEQTVDPDGVFREMATLGTTGTGTEKGLGATYLALAQDPEGWRDTYNAGFYRDEASITTIVISDESDQTPDNLVAKNEFIEWYNALKLKSNERSFSAVLNDANGDRYLDVVDQIGGSWWPIDLESAEWDRVLDDLGVQASGLKTEFFLSHLPVESTITVDLELPDGTILPDDQAARPWDYVPERNSIKYREFIPDSLTKVKISYTLLSSAQDPDAAVTLPEE